MERQLRTAAIHDISCFGKCSLTVALPILSAAGIETSVIPTAVLSTHTGGFSDFTYRDLTEDILPIVNHWKTLDLSFDAVYTGFLGSFEQIEIVSQVFDFFREQNALVAVDPVMADNGKLYSIFPENFPEGMRKLCKKADLLIPNMTEAALLLGREYQEGPYTEDFLTETLKALSALGPKRVVLTGVYFENKTLGAAGYDAESGEVHYAFAERVEGYFHGTGDVFASALISALLRGVTLEQALSIAVDFTVGSIRRTAEAKTDIRFGVNFEAALAPLAQAIENARR